MESNARGGKWGRLRRLGTGRKRGRVWPETRMIWITGTRIVSINQTTGGGSWPVSGLGGG